MNEQKYRELFDYVENILIGYENNNASKLAKKFPFRVRSMHIWRVYIWAKRLIDKEIYKNINEEALLIASLFHDIGYAISPESKEHQINSEILFNEYCEKNKVKDKEFIAYLIKNHSNKILMEREETPIELIILMEADMLDETGSMSIVWDCMAEGNMEEQSYEKTYEHIKKHTMQENNPMKTKKAKEYWENKKIFIENFINEYEYDLGIE